MRELEEVFVGEEWGGPKERGKRGHLAQPAWDSKRKENVRCWISLSVHS